MGAKAGGEEKRPFAGYDDFDACILDQVKKGHPEEHARKICGYLQAQTEKRDAVDARPRLKGSIGSIDKTNRSVAILASTPNPVEGEALTNWDLSRFVKNPVILWGHDSQALPIGTADPATIAFDPEQGLSMRVRLASAAANEVADQVWHGINEGIVRAVSVGYDPPAKAGGPAVLAEVSFVPIGADEDAGTSLLNPEALDEPTATKKRISHAASVLAKHRAAIRSMLGTATNPNAIQVDPTLLENDPNAGYNPSPAALRADSGDVDMTGPGRELRMDRNRLGKAERTSTGGARVPAFLTRTGVLTYVLPDGTRRRELRTDEEVFDAKSLATLSDVPVIDIENHHGLVTPESWRKVALGHVSAQKQNGKYVAGGLVIQDKTALDAIDSGDRTEVSCGYSCSLDFTPGTHEGVQYDCVQRNIRYNHVALCPPNRGRAGPEVGLKLDANHRWGVTRIDGEEHGQRNSEDDVKIIHLDGKDLEFGSDAHIGKLDELSKRAIDQVRTDAKATLDAADAKAKAIVDDLTTKLEKATGALDATKAELETVRTDAKKAKDGADEEKVTMSKEMAKRIAKRLRLYRAAIRFFGEKEDPDEEKMDAMTDREIMVAALKKVDKKFDANDSAGKPRSDDYIEARFDSVCELRQSQNGIDGVVRTIDEQVRRMDSNAGDGAAANIQTMDEARKKRDEAMKNAWKTGGAK